VRDEHTTIRSTLHGAEDTGSSGGACQTDVKEAFERTTVFAFVLGGFGELVLAISLLNTGEGIGQIQF